MARSSPRDARKGRDYPKRLHEQRKLFEIKQRRAEERRHARELADLFAENFMKKKRREVEEKELRIKENIRDV